MLARSPKRSGQDPPERIVVSRFPRLTILLLAALAAACSGQDSRGDVEPVGSSEEASVEEFQTAVSEAAGALLASDAVEAVQYHYGEEGDVVDRTWLDYRGPTRFAMVQVIDFAAKTSRPDMLAVIHAGETPLAATGPVGQMGEWTDIARDERVPTQAPPPDDLGVPTPVAPLLAAVDGSSQTEAIEEVSGEFTVTRQDSSDGGTTWTLTGPGAAPHEQTWTVHPDGDLAAYRFVPRVEADVGGAPVPRGLPFVVEVSFQPIEDPAPLPQPEEGTSFEMSVFRVPADFIP